MLDDDFLLRLERAREIVANWSIDLPPDQRDLLNRPEVAEQLVARSYLEGYLRIKHTVPLILHAIERLDRTGRTKEARFWMRHLSEEAFHDRIMRADLMRMMDGARLTSIHLRTAKMTPPSAALLGYFEWQVTQGNPSLLIAMRLFLEWFIARMENWRVSAMNGFVQGGSNILLTHKELDQDHVRPCTAYIQDYCRKFEPELHWSIDHCGRCLRDAQLYLGQALLVKLA